MQENINQDITSQQQLPNVSLNSEITTASDQPVQEKKKSKKFKFGLKFYLILSLALALSFFVAVNKISEYIKYQESLRISYKEDKPQIITEPEPVKETKKEYRNEKYNFSFTYPINSVLVEDYESDLPSFYIYNKGDKQGTDLMTSENIVDGYLFKVNIIDNPVNKDLKIISQNRLNAFKSTCPSSASFTQVYDYSIDNMFASAFKVFSCSADFEVIITLYNNDLYEFQKVSRGDIGYKENYVNELYLIEKSTTFLNKPSEMPAEFVVYENKDQKFKISYPAWVERNCCRVNKPVSGSYEELLNVGDLASFERTQGRSFSGVSFYYLTEKTLLDYNGFVENQKNTLAENYRLVKGTNPQGTQTELDLNGIKWTKLEGYAWWGTIYLTRGVKNNYFYVVSVSEALPGVFVPVVEKVLSTMEYL